MGFKLNPKLYPLMAYLRARCFLVCLIFITGNYQSATAASAQDSTIKAALTLNFARFTEWPTSVLPKTETTVRLCVLGDNEIQESFSEVDKKQVGERTLSVINMTRLKNVEQCHLLYISDLDRNKTIQLLNEISNHHILTLSEDKQYFLNDGGMVNLEITDGKVNMQINLSAVTKAELIISSMVLKLATIVNP